VARFAQTPANRDVALVTAAMTPRAAFYEASAGTSTRATTSSTRGARRLALPAR